MSIVIRISKDSGVFREKFERARFLSQKIDNTRRSYLNDLSGGVGKQDGLRTLSFRPTVITGLTVSKGSQINIFRKSGVTEDKAAACMIDLL